MNKESSIALLTCWYGNYPWYLPYFIHSCKHNPTIDFILVTDNQEVIPNKPTNVIVIYKTLEEVKAIASEKLGFTINFEKAYKFCDLKPAFGLFFQDIFEQYDFWGHGDIDMVYGNIRGFMTPEVLDNHDIISAHHNFITGTFCLYRNNDQMRNLFMESRDYKRVFSDPEYLGFDECDHLFYELEAGASIFDFPERTQSMTYVVRKAEAEGRLNPFFDYFLMQGMSKDIKWDNGTIVYLEKMEGMFYDLIKYKAECVNKIILDPIPDVFYFDPNGVKTISKFKAFVLKTKARFNF
jgi:hypothetical protein